MKDRGLRCPYEECGQRYASQYNVKRHIAATHPDFIVNQCSVCHRVLSSRQNLRQHEFIHTGEKPYRCTLCGEMFRQSSQLSLHRKQHFSQARSQPIAKVRYTQLTEMLREAKDAAEQNDLGEKLVQLPPVDSKRRDEKSLPVFFALC